MKRVLILCGILLLIIGTQAKAQRDKEFQIRGGIGFSIYYAESMVNYGIEKMEDNNGALSLQFPLEFRYELTERWNVGLDTEFGTYLYENDVTEGNSNRFFVFGIAGEYNILNDDYFRWYAGLGLHTASLVLEETNEYASIEKEEWTYRGGGMRINTGVLLYIGEVGGFNFNLGYDTHNLTLDEYVQNGTKQDMSKIDGKLKISGLDGTIGLVLRIPRKRK
ncbi:MAG: outer membrane beta-barrel protein [Bacteroidetes bacterium]|nr:outer membrane beta-barrel protein [Bacteroidota bacterium]